MALHVIQAEIFCGMLTYDIRGLMLGLFFLLCGAWQEG
jgi:hypothetical protein